MTRPDARIADRPARQLADAPAAGPFGNGTPRTRPRPVVEPLWTGRPGPGRDRRRRRGAHRTTIGDPVAGHRRSSEAPLPRRRRAAAPGRRRLPDQADGHATAVGVDVADGRPADRWAAGRPPIGRDRRTVDDRGRKARRRLALPGPSRPDDEVGFVAIDLLWLDDTSLLDVPLLERRRLLEAVARRVGRGPARRVRPAADRRVGRLVARAWASAG